MPNITFTGVVLKSFSRSKKGGSATFHANFTEAVMKKLGWQGFHSGQQRIVYESGLAATSAVLKPRDGELAKWEIGIELSGIAGFEAYRFEEEGTRGKAYRFELRFQASFADTTGCRRLEEFMVHIGEAKSTLEVKYTAQAELEETPDPQLQLDTERAKATSKAED